MDQGALFWVTQNVYYERLVGIKDLVIILQIIQLADFFKKNQIVHHGIHTVFAPSITAFI